MRHSPHAEKFRQISLQIAWAMGTPAAFGSAAGAILVWIALGPLFHFSDTWQLVINTATNIVTFLMVFLIQNAQNRDMRAVQLKLDELIRGVKGARTELVDLEEMTDAELEQMQEEFKKMHERLHRAKLKRQTRNQTE